MVFCDFLGAFCWRACLATLGGLILARYVLAALCGIYKAFLRPAKNLKRAYGDWAVVTGATDGIGKAMSIDLARRGLNVVLISRTKAKLDEVAAEIKEQFSGIETKSVVVDFANFNAEAEQRVQAALQPLSVGVLVNNVGASYPYPLYFNEVAPALVSDLVSLNITSVVGMTRIVLPMMEAAGRGAIVNIASASAMLPAPLLAEYAAAKAFVVSFTEALALEYRGRGIHIQAQTPMYVVSKMSKFKRATLTVPSPETYARAAVNQIGYDTITNPHWTHALMLWVASLAPRSLVGSRILTMHANIRRSAQRKMAAAAPGEASGDDKKKTSKKRS